MKTRTIIETKLQISEKKKDKEYDKCCSKKKKKKKFKLPNDMMKKASSTREFKKANKTDVEDNKLTIEYNFEIAGTVKIDARKVFEILKKLKFDM